MESTVQFENWIEQHRGAIWRIVRSYAPDSDRDDLLQEIHLQLWRSRDQFQGHSSPLTWVYRVALNTALSFRNRRPVSVELDQTREPVSVGSPVSEHELLLRFMAQLTDVNRATFLLHLEGLEYKHIAEILACPPGTVAARLTRIRQQLEADFIEEADNGF